MNAPPEVWAWMGVAVLGGAFSLWNLVDARGELSAVRESGHNGTLVVVSSANVRRESVRLSFWVIAFLMGLASVFGAEGDYLVWALIVVMALNAFNSFGDLHERREVRRLSEGS